MVGVKSEGVRVLRCEWLQKACDCMNVEMWIESDCMHWHVKENAMMKWSPHLVSRSSTVSYIN